MMSNASTSLVTRYRPAVLAIASIAAVISAYLVVTGLETPAVQTKHVPALRRRNAIHRSDRQPGWRNVQIQFNYQPGDVFPEYTCILGNDRFTVSLSESSMPPNEYFDSLNESAANLEQIITIVSRAALDCLFQSFVNLPSESPEYQLYTGIRQALANQDFNAMLQHESEFVNGRWKFDASHFRYQVEQWCRRLPMLEDPIERSGRPYAASPEALTPNATDTIPPISTPVTTASPATMRPLTTLAADSPSPNDDERGPSQGLKSLLYHIAEEEAKKQNHVHRTTRCDICNASPITGIRWHCINCPDYDLCSNCEALDEHLPTHIFAKIKVPICSLSRARRAQKSYYPGFHTQHPRRLSRRDRDEISRSFDIESTQLDAYYEKFMCLSTSISERQPSLGDMAITKSIFQKAFTVSRAIGPLESSFLVDRMFDFYDTNKDGLVTFEEFVAGQTYLKTIDTTSSLERVFNGFDVNQDGYISRVDVLRLLRGKYAIHKAMIQDLISVQEEQPRAVDQALTNFLRSQQPISARFTDADTPQGQTRIPQTKPRDVYGDPQTLPDPIFHQLVLPNGESDMDATFWDAVFDRYGRPKRFSELNPRFEDRLYARTDVRDRYLGDQLIQSTTQDDSLDMFNVLGDPRPARSFSTKQNAELIEKYENMAKRGTDMQESSIIDAKETTSNLDRILGNDKTYQVDAEDRETGQEVLFQVVEEALNEVLDDIFRTAEELAKRVKETKADRERHALKLKSKTLLTTDFDAVKETTPLSRQTSAMDSPWSARTNRRRNQFFSPTSNATPGPLADRANFISTPTFEPPENAASILSNLSTNFVPTDDDSLQRESDAIREQSLDALLESSGYSIAQTSGDAEGHQVDLSSDMITTDVQPDDLPGNESSQSHTDNNENHSTNDDNNPNGATSSLVPNASTNQLLPDSTNDSQANDIFTNLAVTTVIPDTKDDADQYKELPWNMDTIRTPQDDDDADKTNGSEDVLEAKEEHSANRTPVLQINTQLPQIIYGLDDQESITDNEIAEHVNQTAEHDTTDEKAPSMQQLIEWAKLDLEEKKIIERNGPARINLAEFEEIIEKDRTEQVGKLRELVASWLEWAAF